MAIEFFDGFENGVVEPMPWILVVQTSAGFSLGGVGTGRGGGRALQSAAASRETALWLPSSAKKTWGSAFLIGNSAFFGTTGKYLVSVRSDVGVTQHLTVMWDVTGHIVVRRGNTAGTVLATSTQVLPVASWHYIEVQATIDDTLGTCIVKVDGVEWINFVGDTRNAGTSTLIDSLFFMGAQGLTGQPDFDDMYVTNGTDATVQTGRPDTGFLGDVKVEQLLPNGNGASSQWLGSDSNSVDNYLLVDEHPPNTTDYVTAGPTDVGKRDLYDLASLAVADQQVLAIQPGFYGVKTDSGAASVKSLIREASGTVTADATAVPLSTTYSYGTGTMRTTKPGGGVWTVADVNALQMGIEKTS